MPHFYTPWKRQLKCDIGLKWVKREPLTAFWSSVHVRIEFCSVKLIYQTQYENSIITNNINI